MRLVLASASPRRADLLRAAGFTFETLPVDVDETVQRGEAADAYVRRLAVEKAAEAWGRISGDRNGPVVVIGADTAVVVDGDILGKPENAADAERMIRRLSGRSHQVMTGISILGAGSERGCVETTDVECLAMTDAEISWYVATGEGQDKAGAYAIQGLASRFMTRIAGSYANVVGLPVHAVFELLRDLP